MLLRLTLIAGLLVIVACGGDPPQVSTGAADSTASQGSSAFPNTPQGAAAKFLNAVEREDANQYLDAVDPQYRSEPGFGFAQALLQSLAGLFGLSNPQLRLAFRDLSFTPIATANNITLLQVQGFARNLSMYTEDEFDQVLVTRRIENIWYVSNLTSEEFDLFPQLKPGVATIVSMTELPRVITIDKDGAIYFSDGIAIYKVTGATATLLAGDPSNAGYRDGRGRQARFADVTSLTFGNDGNIYVADGGNHRIRRVSTGGDVTTVAGSGPSTEDTGGKFVEGGFADDPGRTARFNTPTAVVVDKSGTLYVGDSRNNRIRKIRPDNVVSTFAGSHPLM